MADDQAVQVPQAGGAWQVEAEGVAFQVGASSLTADVGGASVEIPFETALTQQVSQVCVDADGLCS